MKSLRVSASVWALLAISSPAIAQNSQFGSNDLYYNRQVSEGMYANARYDSQYYSYYDFYENLAPYGQWIQDERLGYVWSPDVDKEFRPYFTNGYWVMSDYGNTWVSNYNWGWACFHYGRWTYDSYYGWLWIPGQDWGPAWVSWREGRGNYGWAPLAPGYTFSESELNQYDCPKDWWVFIPRQYLYNREYYRFYTGPLGSSNALKVSELRDNTYSNNGVTYVNGPSLAQIKEALSKPASVMHLRNAGSPRVDRTHHDILKSFRPPLVHAANVEGEQYAPVSYIKAPRAIKQPEDVNSLSGTLPTFRRDLPALLKKNAATAKPVKKVKTDVVLAREAERADKNEYRTEVPTSQPKVSGSYELPKEPEKELPKQGNQRPEPVKQPKKNDLPPLPPVSQQADPIPQPKKGPTAPTPAPVQHPEPLNPGSR